MSNRQPTIRFDIPATFRVPGTPQRAAPRFVGSTGTGGAFAFAESLAQINPQLQRFLGAGFDLYQERERARADEFSRNHVGSYADAVRNGELPAGASPFFRERVIRNEVQSKGRHFNAWLQAQWQGDAAVKGADESTFETWLSTKTADYAARELNQYASTVVSEEFDGLARQAQQNLAVQHIADGFRRTKQRGVEALNDGLLSAVREVQTTSDIMPFAERLVSMGGSIDGKSDMEIRRDYIARYIERKTEEAYNSGFSHSEINGIVTETLGFLALESGDTGVLELGDHVKAGTGPLSGTLAFREMALNVSHKIARQEEAAARQSEAVATKQRKAQLDQLRLQVWRLGVDQPDELLDLALNYGGDDPDELDIITDTLNALDRPVRGGTEHTSRLIEVTSDARLGRFEPEEIEQISRQEGYTAQETATLLQINESGRTRIERSVQSDVDEIVEQFESAAKVENAGYGIQPHQALAIRREKRRLQDEIADLYDQHDGVPPRDKLYAVQDAALQRGLTSLTAASGSASLTGGAATVTPTVTQPIPEAVPTVETSPTPQSTLITSPAGNAIQVPLGALEFLRANSGDPSVLHQFNVKYFNGESVAETLIGD